MGSGAQALRQPAAGTAADKSALDQAAQREERLEKEMRTVIENPHDAAGKITGIGRGFDSTAVDKARVQTFLDAQTPDALASLDNPNTVVTITATASRPGSEEYNKALTAEFGENLKQTLIEDFGVKAQIVVVAQGESQAAKERKPESKDDPGDRGARIDIKPGERIGGDQDDAVDSVINGIPKPPTDKNAEEVGRIVIDAAKDGVQNLDPKEAAKTLAKEGVKWMGKKLGQDLADQKLMGPLAANYAAGVLDGLADQAGVAKRPHHSPLFDPKSGIYRGGVEAAQHLRETLPAKAWENIRTVMQNPKQRPAFEARLAEKIQLQVLARRGQHGAQ